MSREIAISALAVAILISVSCDGPCGPSIPPAAITDDNSGGAIAFYQTWRASDAGFHVEFYAQRISSEGDFLWGERGILIASWDAPFYETGHLHAISDGSGGAVISWYEPLLERPYSRLHVARIDSGGNTQWQRAIPSAKKVIHKEEAIPDGSGGVIISYVDGNFDMSVLKIDAEGNLPWGENGVPLDLGDSYWSHVAGDGLGGVIVVRYGVGNISAQRVDSGGNVLWRAGGVHVGSAQEARVVSDGAGGAIVVFPRDISCADIKPGNCSNLYAQRIDAKGNLSWGSDGVPIRPGPSIQLIPEIVDDRAGGAIVFFKFIEIERGHPTLHAQRIDSDGHKLWNGAVVLSPITYGSPVSDGFGGAITVGRSRDGRSGGAQRLDARGKKLWGPDGIMLTFQSDSHLVLAPDGRGGVFISYSAVKRTGHEVHQASYYVQRVDPEGNVVWGNKGILLNP